MVMEFILVFKISIHALRKECDVATLKNKPFLKDFYPRTP